jgi:hypothetical protein
VTPNIRPVSPLFVFEQWQAWAEPPSTGEGPTDNWQLATAMTLAPPDALDRAMLFGTNEMVEMNSALTITVLPRRPEPAITRRFARSQTALQERPR